jgi:alpha-beta hydrolase superfamily lysophospholipase
MHHIEGTFTSKDGIKLYYQSWLPKDTVRGILAIVHGLGGHSGMYLNIVKQLIPKNFAVYGVDLRGSGKSPGQRAYINSWDDYRNDVAAFLELVKSQNPEIPCFLFGHSMGGLTILDYLLRYPESAKLLNGAVAFTPALGESGIPPIKLMLGRILSRIYPRFSMNTGMDLGFASRDVEVIKAYSQDTLRHTVGTARLSTEFFTTLAWVQAHAKDLQIPFLMMLAGDDKVTLPEGGRIFFEKVSNQDKELREYPDRYHDMQDDFGYEEVLGDLASWLERHL